MHSCTAASLSLFDHQVGAAKQRKRYGKAEGFGGFRLMTSSTLVTC